MMYTSYGAFGMGGGLFGLVVMAALLVVPFWRILPRNGIPNWVAIFAAFPLIALILLWVVAFKDEVDKSGKGA